jgi:ribonucleoside-diphosphate reductase alpha chain
MQIAQDNATASPALGAALPQEGSAARNAYSEYKVIRRNGAVVGFEPAKISVAMTKAFLAVNGAQGAASARIRELVAGLTEAAVGALLRRQPQGGTFHIEDIQDQVELALMRSGEHDVARAYVLYREERSKARAQEKAAKTTASGIQVVEGGQRRPLDRQWLARLIESACEGLAAAAPGAILEATLRDLYDGVPMEEVRKSAVLAARALIEEEPAYGYVTARLLLNTIRLEVLGEETTQAEMRTRYAAYFPQCIQRGIGAELLDPELGGFDLDRLGKALQARRDLQFNYLGLQTLYDRYFLHLGGRRIELPQTFFMRVAMGLALKEKNREERAIEFYDVLSSFDFMSSTPTLFNAGTRRSQLSSCYLTTVRDDLEGIYDAIKENALLAKYAGGLGNDWTPVRALGSHIKGTNGKSQGVVPFLKVVNDTAVAVNQGGKRKGAVCSYLETWHLDIEEFLELRKNTGDDRRRTHDMNTANWIPDLFMKRVMENADWTLFSPSDVGVPALRGPGGARRAQALQEDPGGAAVAQDAVDALRDRASLDHVQGSLQPEKPPAARGRGAQLEPVHRDHAQHLGRRDRGLQPGLGEPGRAHDRPGSGLLQAESHHPHGDADAGQRHRHQLLRRRQGA